jgi:hypothetical protein
MTENSRGWQARLRRAPLWVIGLATAVMWSVVMLGMDALQGKDLGVARVGAVAAGGTVVAVGVVLVGRWGQARDRKLPPGAATARNLNRAVATGKLPGQAIAEEWVPGLRKIIRQDRHMIWVGPLVFGLFAASGIFLIFDRPDHPWFGVACTVFFIVAAIWMPIWVRRRRARIEGLIAEMTNRDAWRGDRDGG